MNLAKLEQDSAAGGEAKRKLQVRSGEIFTVSLSVRERKSEPVYAVVLRYKTGGTTIQRHVGTVNASSRTEALQLGWKKIREDQIVEAFQWSWISP